MGPVPLSNNVNLKLMIDDLKKFGHYKHYLHLQIRPYSSELEAFLKKDIAFQPRILFPYHKKEEFDLNIYNVPLDKLLLNFKPQGRRKIVLAGRAPFKFCKLKNEDELKDVRQLFIQVAKIKNYNYIPFRVFRNIFRNGKKHNLCEIYLACLNDEIVNAILIVKDAQSFYHLTSGLLIRGFKNNESPSAKLHYFLMQDCFYVENKKYYNISYGGSDNLIRFKEQFNPVEVKKPSYYTYIINKKAISFFQRISLPQATFMRSVFKVFGKFIKLSSLLFYSTCPIELLIY